MKYTTSSHVKGKAIFQPNHHYCSNWVFDLESEAELCNSLAVVAEENGVSRQEFIHLFPVVLRTVKSKSNWACYG